MFGCYHGADEISSMQDGGAIYEGRHMRPSADVSFFRAGDKVEIVLGVDGQELARRASPESIANECQIRGIRFLTIDGLFFAPLPTSEETLALAADVAFSEPMAALKLLAACSAMGETALFPYPERRARPRRDLGLRDDAGPGARKRLPSR